MFTIQLRCCLILCRAVVSVKSNHFHMCSFENVETGGQVFIINIPCIVLVKCPSVRMTWGSQSGSEQLLNARDVNSGFTFIADKFLWMYLKTGVLNGAVWNVFNDFKYTINLCLFGHALVLRTISVWLRASVLAARWINMGLTHIQYGCAHV